MSTIAVYSLKGGVGKTTLAVNLAWLSAVRSARSTLLWDLDPQAASTFLLGGTGGAGEAVGEEAFSPLLAFLSGFGGVASIRLTTSSLRAEMASSPAICIP